eukprot:CAMPEP_0116834084 /NCGR_PEP_ID=MMETSP0418-20121206/6795_1 /TAXON_ID=1158023 /ORGANISM="Astrosyne radiata, Strain 13vi08-1A" /LENGTH=88 /DNA_ID=CAMNT_0004463605 /DNA_START=77 /DNA_END=343 /DNA_ORIENTATION=+
MNRGGGVSSLFDRQPNTSSPSFSGHGTRLGGSLPSPSPSSMGLSSVFRSSSPRAKEDLVDRREKARMAAMARLERNKGEQPPKQETAS